MDVDSPKADTQPPPVQLNPGVAKAFAVSDVVSLTVSLLVSAGLAMVATTPMLFVLISGFGSLPWGGWIALTAILLFGLNWLVRRRHPLVVVAQWCLYLPVLILTPAYSWFYLPLLVLYTLPYILLWHHVRAQSQEKR